MFLTCKISETCPCLLGTEIGLCKGEILEHCDLCMGTAPCKEIAHDCDDLSSCLEICLETFASWAQPSPSPSLASSCFRLEEECDHDACQCPE